MIKLLPLLRSLFLMLVIIISACGSGGSDSKLPAKGPTELPLADYELLFIGNSHSSVNGLPNLVTKLLKTGEPGKSANAKIAQGSDYLAERIDDGVTLETLESRAWTHVFLQAQKYSSSGINTYPTDAAQEWIRRTKAQNALPIMFPEWPRRGNTEEGQRVYDLHVSIASQEPACVAPVGPVWDEFILSYPEIELHGTDGNHSSLNGALLTAYVFYQVISGHYANDLAYIRDIDVSEELQEKLKEIAFIFHNVHLPCP
jgi:hypothetical protein